MLCLLTTATLTLNGCGHVEVKDEVLYFDEGSSGAHYKNFLTPNEGDLDKASWDDIREGYVCMSPDAWGDFKTEVGKFCTLPSVHCDYTAVQALNRIFDYIAAREAKRTRTE